MIGLIIFILLILAVLFLNHPLFGKPPSGKRLEKIIASPNFEKKQVKNLIETPQLTAGYTMSKVMFDFIFAKKSNVKPKNPIPVVELDFTNLDLSKDAYYWFGHSSYMLIMDQKIFLIDPVFTKNASPILSSNNTFKGTNFINIDSLPSIDYLIITHDHFDHLDYSTIKRIKSKVDTVICGLGVGSHFEYWGYNSNKIVELDWWEDSNLDGDFKITATPVRHFSGRTLFYKNNTLFCSFVLQNKSKKIFIGGDSGYGPHFKKINEYFGVFDYAFIENGQYHDAWHYIHLHPEEFQLVLTDLPAKAYVPVHHSKFALSHHSWNDPLNNIVKNRSEDVLIQTPMIGEKVLMDDYQSEWKTWWKEW